MNNLFKSFKDLDIRVGTIIHVERFEEAIKSSYKLKIDFGELGVFKIFDTDNKKLYTWGFVRISSYCYCKFSKKTDCKFYEWMLSFRCCWRPFSYTAQTRFKDRQWS